MKVLLYIIVLISLLSYQASSYTCYATRQQKIDLMKTVPDIANNLDSQGEMNFQNHQYRWYTNYKTKDNISIRFQFKREGNEDSSIMFLPGFAYDYFQLTLRQYTMIVKVVSDNSGSYVKEFPISSAIDQRYVWFAFAFYRDHVEVYYDGRLAGQFKANLRLQMFNKINYYINNHHSFQGNPVVGYMTNFQLFPDIQLLSFIPDCIGSGYYIYNRNQNQLASKFLDKDSELAQEYIEEIIDRVE